MNELLILVDEHDHPLGKMEKLLVHQRGELHRAFSVFIFNSKGEFLLQQRADGKYHSPGLWSNTCCSHPHVGEATGDAVSRRLFEEMGIRCETKFIFHFIYRIDFENGLIEHEYDHVYFGVSDQLPAPENTEVKNWKYMSLQALENELREQPEQFTAWLKICFPEVRKQVVDLF